MTDRSKQPSSVGPLQPLLLNSHSFNQWTNTSWTPPCPRHVLGNKRWQWVGCQWSLPSWGSSLREYIDNEISGESWARRLPNSSTTDTKKSWLKYNLWKLQTQFRFKGKEPGPWNRVGTQGQSIAEVSDLVWGPAAGSRAFMSILGRRRGLV